MTACYNCNTNSRMASAMAPACTSASFSVVSFGSTVFAVLIFIALACLIIGAVPVAVISLALILIATGMNKTKACDAQI